VALIDGTWTAAAAITARGVTAPATITVTAVAASS
jgi:hypothetical protein